MKKVASCADCEFASITAGILLMARQLWNETVLSDILSVKGRFWLLFDTCNWLYFRLFHLSWNVKFHPFDGLLPRDPPEESLQIFDAITHKRPDQICWEWFRIEMNYHIQMFHANLKSFIFIIDFHRTNKGFLSCAFVELDSIVMNQLCTNR